ncbi:hypothetical protein [Streptomyces sp. NPDC050704]|uniref:hypothetical protein n=1 Tax=Streptomyces sp. NPDC050704 TaxID=3157219 RepID=UPI0034290147
MPLVAALVLAALVLWLEHVLQVKFGWLGIAAFVALTVGIKAKNTMIGGIGAAVLVFLLVQSG